MSEERTNGTTRDESFRDSIATVDKRGKRVWIYPKKPAGKWFNKRALLGYTLLVVLFAGPFIRIAGEPLLQIDVLERRFVIFGQKRPTPSKSNSKELLPKAEQQPPQRQ